MRVPLQTIRDLLAVRRQTPSSKEDLGPGNTDTKAPESTRNSLLERMSFRKRRVELQNSSGAEATGGGPAGWTGVSTCQTTGFLKRNKISNSCQLSGNASCGTIRVMTEQRIWKLEMGFENTWREEETSQRLETSGPGKKLGSPVGLRRGGSARKKKLNSGKAHPP